VIASQTPCLQVLFIVSNSKHTKPEMSVTISRPRVLFFFLINFCFVYIDSFFFFFFFLISIPYIYISFTFIFVFILLVFPFFYCLFSFHTHRVCTSLNHNLLLCRPIYIISWYVLQLRRILSVPPTVILKQYRESTHNLTLRRVRAAIVAVLQWKSNKHYIF